MGKIFALIYGIIPGILFGIMVGKQITARRIKKSNDIGDSGSVLEDFSDGLEVICHEESVTTVY
jgi:hypothetical protein